MRRIKQVFNYLIGKEIVKDLKIDWELNPKKNLGKKILDTIDCGCSLITRYVPLALEIDGVRRLFEEQYLGGAIELIGAEYLRILEYKSRKQKRKIRDEEIESTNLFKDIGEEMDKTKKIQKDIGKKIKELDTRTQNLY